MIADKAYRCQRSGKHFNHHRNRQKCLAEEFTLAGSDIAYGVEGGTLDNKENKGRSDLDVTFIACAEFLKKDKECSRAQYGTGDIFRTKAPDASDR